MVTVISDEPPDLALQATNRRHGGRPCAGKHGSVADALMTATASCLRERSHLDLSLRDIASRAGTSHTMIRYYFNSKEGLLLAVLESTTGKLEMDLKRLRKTISALPGSPTGHVLSCLANGIFSNSEILRVAITEIGRTGSEVGEAYLNRAVRRVFAVCRSIIRDLIRSGQYKATLNERLATYTLTGLVTLGLTRLPHLPLLGLDVDDIASESWVDFVTPMLDAQFAADPTPNQSPYILNPNVIP